MSGEGEHAGRRVPSVHFTREMGLDHAEFFRGLPAALGPWPWRVEGGCVTVDLDGCSLCIEVGEQGTRRIATLRLPVTPVTFILRGPTGPAFDAFMARFDLYFRRGGG